MNLSSFSVETVRRQWAEQKYSRSEASEVAVRAIGIVVLVVGIFLIVIEEEVVVVVVVIVLVVISSSHHMALAAGPLYRMTTCNVGPL